MTDYAELDRQWSRVWGRAFPDVDDLSDFHPWRQVTTNTAFDDVLRAVDAEPELVAFTTVRTLPAARADALVPPTSVLDGWRHTGTDRNARGLADSLDAHFWVTTDVPRSALQRIAAACDNVIITDSTCSWALAPLHADSELFVVATARARIAKELDGATPLVPATLLPASERQLTGSPGQLNPDVLRPGAGTPTVMPRARDRRVGIDATTALTGLMVSLPASVFAQAPHYDLCESARGFNGLDGDPGPCDCWKSYAQPLDEEQS
ncbi:hypothetical protein ACWGJ9_08010 [Curtobacterium citreum]